MILLDVLFAAPIIAVSKRWPRVVHAVEVEALVEGWNRGTFVSACGVSGLRLMGAALDDGSDFVGLFPPRLKGMPDEMSRCRTCWEATGRKRPRCSWTRRDAS